MRRREFITLLGGAAAAWPLASSAAPVGQIPRLGVIDDGPNWDHFRQGLREFGYVVGQNVASSTDLQRAMSIACGKLRSNLPCCR